MGIDDKGIWIAYILCIASTVLCLAYGCLNWNKGAESLKSDDLNWIDEERKAEDEL